MLHRSSLPQASCHARHSREFGDGQTLGSSRVGCMQPALGSTSSLFLAPSAPIDSNSTNISLICQQMTSLENPAVVANVPSWRPSCWDTTMDAFSPPRQPPDSRSPVSHPFCPPHWACRLRTQSGGRTRRGDPEGSDERPGSRGRDILINLTLPLMHWRSGITIQERE
jgi:hypothetical protein